MSIADLFSSLVAITFTSSFFLSCISLSNSRLLVLAFPNDFYGEFSFSELLLDDFATSGLLLKLFSSVRSDSDNFVFELHPFVESMCFVDFAFESTFRVFTLFHVK